MFGLFSLFSVKTANKAVSVAVDAFYRCRFIAQRYEKAGKRQNILTIIADGRLFFLHTAALLHVYIGQSATHDARREAIGLTA